MCWWTRQKPICVTTPDDNAECALCLEPIRRRMAVCTECGNGMHKHCLDKWKLQCVLSERTFTCPLCRAELT